jgi:hypothetical protein
MTIVVETTNDANAKMLAAMLRNLNFVKAVTFKPAKNNKQKPSPEKQKSLSKEDWIMPGRPATDEEIEQMLDECEASPELTLEKAKALTLKEIREWKKSK